MAEENRNTEGSQGESNTTNTASKQSNAQDMLAELWKFLNQPAVASAGLGVFLSWALNPKGLKETMEHLNQQIEELVKVSGEQKEEMHSLRKRIKRLVEQLSGVDENEGDSEKTSRGMNGYHKAGKRAGTFFLD